MHPVKYGSAHNLQQHLLMEEDGSSFVFSTSNLHHPQQQSPIFQHQELFQQNPGHLFHHQQPRSAVHFKPSLDRNSGKNKQESALNHQQNDATFLHGNQHSLFTESACFQESFWKSFGELEAIYGETTQAGSGSALTGENSPANVAFNEFQGHNVGANGGPETSIGEQASLRKIEKKKRKKKLKEQLCSMLVFFENLVKQVTVHQEGLHKRFWEVTERMDKERSEKEESWRQQEAEKREGEAIARANERALASSRDTLMVSYLDKITGQSINLPLNES